MRIRRATWSIADQGLSSLTNFVLFVAAARVLDVEAFGAFAVALAGYLFAAGLARAVCGEILIIKHSANGAADRAGAALGGALGLGLASGLLALVAAGFADQTLRLALLALALLLPGLLVQDALRYLFIALSRPNLAFANDLLWALLQVVLVGAVLFAGRDGVDELIAAWGVAALLAALVGLVQLRTWPRLDLAIGWFREHGPIWPRYLTEFVATMGAWQITLLAIGAVGGLGLLGGLRAAQVLYGPLHVVNYGARLAVVPEGVRDRAAGAAGAAGLTRAVSRAAGAMAGVAVIWTVAVVVLPDSLGRTLLGDSWAEAAEVALPFGLFMVLQALIGAAVIGLRIVVAAGASLRAALQTALVLVALAVGCAATGNIVAVGWGLVIAALFGVAAWWKALRNVLATLGPLVPNPG